jgi:hypothetical protein
MKGNSCCSSEAVESCLGEYYSSGVGKVDWMDAVQHTDPCTLSFIQPIKMKIEREAGSRQSTLSATVTIKSTEMRKDCMPSLLWPTGFSKESNVSGLAHAAHNCGPR